MSVWREEFNEIQTNRSRRKLGRQYGSRDVCLLGSAHAARAGESESSSTALSRRSTHAQTALVALSRGKSGESAWVAFRGSAEGRDTALLRALFGSSPAALCVWTLRKTLSPLVTNLPVTVHSKCSSKKTFNQDCPPTITSDQGYTRLGTVLTV